MYELIDSAYWLRSIAPSMWPVFELTYTLFRHEAVGFLEGALISANIYSSIVDPVGWGNTTQHRARNIKIYWVDAGTRNLTMLTRSSLFENSLIPWAFLFFKITQMVSNSTCLQTLYTGTLARDVSLCHFVHFVYRYRLDYGRLE